MLIGNYWITRRWEGMASYKEKLVKLKINLYAR